MRCGSATLQRLFVSDLLPRKPLALQSAKGFHFWNMIPHRFSGSSMNEGLELAHLSDTTPEGSAFLSIPLEPVLQ
jgi:hypothetical protein